MGNIQEVHDTAVRIKKKGHPIGKLGKHVKRGGLLLSATAFFRENRWARMPRIGEGSIRP